MEERFATVRGQPLRYLVCGRGKPLVLCHGFLSSAEEFGGRFSELGAYRTLIIPDLPGNGASPPLPGRHSSGAMADVVFDLLSELEIDRFDVGGLCLGATVACALAKRAGARAERLVLHTPLLSSDLMRRRYRDQVRLLSRRPMWDGVVWLSRQRWVSDLYKRFVIVEGDVDDRTADINYENQRRADPRAAREWLNDCLRRDDVDVVAARAERTLIIVARHDRLVDVGKLKGLIATLPGLHVFTDSDQGHGWNEAAVHRQLEVLKEFFGNCHGNGSVASNRAQVAMSGSLGNGRTATVPPVERTGGPRSATRSRSRSRPPDQRRLPGPGRAASRACTLELEQTAFAVDPPAVPGQIPVRADEPMAWDDDRDGILTVGCPNRASGEWLADSRRERAIRRRLSIWDLEQRGPHGDLKWRPVETERELEAVARSLEVLGELLGHGREHPAGGGRSAGDPWCAGMPIEMKAGELVTGADHQDSPERGGRVAE